MTPKIYLASKSPRRQALLHQMQISFDVLDIEVPEECIPGESPETYSLRITHEKLQGAWNAMEARHIEYRPILCADTEVILDHQIIGKPKDRNDAYRMLKNYSNREHMVLTSVGIRDKHGEHILQNKTFVKFATLTDADIEQYLNNNDYLDKAGAYGIQSSIAQFIEKINGCFYSVMGLPLHAVKTLLDDISHNHI